MAPQASTQDVDSNTRCPAAHATSNPSISKPASGTTVTAVPMGAGTLAQPLALWSVVIGRFVEIATKPFRATGEVPTFMPRHLDSFRSNPKQPANRCECRREPHKFRCHAAYPRLLALPDPQVMDSGRQGSGGHSREPHMGRLWQWRDETDSFTPTEHEATLCSTIDWRISYTVPMIADFNSIREFVRAVDGVQKMNRE